MIIVDGLSNFAAPTQGVVLTIGKFDGVHRGHRQILAAARAAADELSLPLVAMTFDPHPAVVLKRGEPFRPLTTHAEKLALLALVGVDVTVSLQATPEFFQKTADEFLGELVAACRPRVIVEGPTFFFGRGRAGSIETLRDRASQHGYRLQIVDEFVGDASAGQSVVHSSAIRAALADGRLDVANDLLGRPYRIAGVVGYGDGRGATIGFATANLDQVPHCLPAHGVYAAIAETAEGALHVAAVNIGPQPTFNGVDARIEAHLLDVDADLRNQKLGLHLLTRLRGQVKFDGVDALRAQIADDVAAVRAAASSGLDRVRAAARPPL